ncbi:MAG TPA: SURF1 family protein [Hyphomonadaceae bacterium]|jgi:surfeit locus 1 family protein|nr:SURF1 family protein [Hyphomonadaceae bacterium]
MMFRPFPILTLVAIPVFVALMALGAWQVQRAQWKSALIKSFETAAAAQPATLDEAFCGQGGVRADGVVKLSDTRGLQLRVFGHNTRGDAGWRLFQAVHPACVSPTGGLLAETGFEPLQIGEMPTTAPATPAGFADKYIIETWPEKPMMAAENSPDRNEWHWFDGPAMSAFLGAGPLDEHYILAKLDGMPDHLTRTPPSGHIGYAVTWFGMAIAFLVIYALFHARAARLRFRKQAAPQDQKKP